MILVTGGAGYIGSVITELLVKKGFEVVVLDNLEGGHRQAVAPEAQFVEGDLKIEEDLENLFEHYPIEAVIHLAASTVVEESVKEPAKYFKNNLFGGVNLLEVMLKHQVKRMVFSSTAAVYGEPKNLPVTEEEPPKPVNPYGLSKFMLEQILESYTKAYSLKAISLRFFNVAGATQNYGPDQKPVTQLIPRLLKVALGELDFIEIFGDDYPTPDGTAIRDYVDVRDLAWAHLSALKALELPLKTTSGRFDIYNLGAEQGSSVKEVIEVTQEVTEKKIPVKKGSRRPGDPAKMVASSKKIKKELGFEPKYPDLKETISSVWEWFKKHPFGYQNRGGSLNSESSDFSSRL